MPRFRLHLILLSQDRLDPDNTRAENTNEHSSTYPGDHELDYRLGPNRPVVAWLFLSEIRLPIGDLEGAAQENDPGNLAVNTVENLRETQAKAAVRCFAKIPSHRA